MAVTFVSAVSVQVAVPANGTATATTASFTPTAGEVLVVKVGTGSSSISPATPTGGSLTWTARATSGAVAGYGQGGIYTATTTTASSMTVSVVFTSTSAAANTGSVVVERYTGAQLATTAATNVVENTTVQSSITATGPTGSVVTYVDVVYSGPNTTPSYLSGAVQTALYQGTNVSTYAAYQATTGPGTYTYGLSSPTGTVTLVALELYAAPTPTLLGTVTASDTVSHTTAGSYVTTSASFTPNVGDLLVVKAAAGWSSEIPSAVSGGGLTWTRRTTASGSSARDAGIWTASATAATAMTVSVTFTTTGTVGDTVGGFVVERWSGAMAATPHVVAAAARTSTLTPIANTSTITWALSQYSTPGDTATPTPSAGTVDYYVRETPVVSTNASLYFGHQSVTSTAAQTFGVSNAGTTSAYLVALELLPPASVTYSGAAVLSAVSGESIAWHDFNPPANATLAATSAVTAAPFSTLQAAATLSATSGETMRGDKAQPASATLSATSGGSFTAGWPIAPGNAVLSAVSALVTEPWLTELAVSTLSATSHMVASPDTFTPPFIAPPGPPRPQVRTPALRLLIAETRTGRILFELPMSALQWDSPILPSTGTITADVPIPHALDSIYSAGFADPRAVLSAFVRGAWRFSIALAFGSSVMWAGPYMPSQNPPDKQVMSIAGVEFPKMFDRRLLYNPAGTSGSWTDPGYDLTFQNVSPQWLIYQLVTAAVTSTSFSLNRELPVYCSVPPTQDGLESITYHAYDTKSVLSAMADVIALPDGPDVRFLPFLTEQDDGDHLAYDLQIGTPYLNRNPIWTWDDSLTLVQRDTDASSMATGVWVPGNGQDQDKVVGWTTLTGGSALNPDISFLGWPALEQVDSNRSSVSDPDLLAAYAEADLAAGATVVDMWTLKVPIDGDPPAGAYRPGDLAQIEIREHPTIEPGTYRRRITDCSGDLTQQVQVIFADLDAVQFASGT